jgi:hypothetical protein
MERFSPNFNCDYHYQALYGIGLTLVAMALFFHVMSLPQVIVNLVAQVT